MDVKIKLIAMIVSMLVMLNLMCGCYGKNGNLRGSSSPANYIDLHAKESYDLIKENEGNKDFIILDVRTPKEYDSGHLANAINMDFNSSDFKEMLATLDKDKPYLVHCRSGGRSSNALKIMREMKFNKVYHMLGGILGWIKAGYPTVKN
ncbi:rhodanese-like domain-containing protein [Candidatus Latescibacterota bacterium]